MKNSTTETGSGASSGNGNQPPPERAFARGAQSPQRLKDTAIEKVEQTGERAREGVEHGRQQLADRIRRVGSVLRSTSDSLKEDDRVVARYAEQASDGFERVARYVNEAELSGVVRDVERFARSRPAVFFGGAFLIGLAAGRFLKSSRERGSNQSGGHASRRDVREDDFEGLFDVDTSAATEQEGGFQPMAGSALHTPPGGIGASPATGITSPQTGGFGGSQASSVPSPEPSGSAANPRKS